MLTVKHEKISNEKSKNINWLNSGKLISFKPVKRLGRFCKRIYGQKIREQKPNECGRIFFEKLVQGIKLYLYTYL